jgi:hypothetical protein
VGVRHSEYYWVQTDFFGVAIFIPYVFLVSHAYCNAFNYRTPFGLLIDFINHVQVVTTINCNTVTHLRNLISLHANLLSLPVVVFTYS